jgi:hypothetical protein
VPHASPPLSSFQKIVSEQLSVGGNKGFSSLIDGECKSSITILRCRHEFVSIVEIVSPVSVMLAYYSIIILKIALRLEIYLIYMMFPELVLHRTIPIVV